MKEYEYWLASVHTDGLGAVRRRKLKMHFGNAKRVFEAKSKTIMELTWLNNEIKKAIISEHKDKNTIEKEYNELINSGIQLFCEYEEDYPARLKKLTNMPDMLFVKGRLPDEKIPSVAIVGSRHATCYGIKSTEYFTKRLADCGVQIISGMAYGIDSCSHETALEYNTKTYAVMGCGINICYPVSKISLYDRIRKSGGIISEFPPGVQPLGFRFPMRNRIIAGLADIVLVVEARKNSGSLITANIALEQGKDIYAVPGRIDDLNSEGCNQLLFDGAVPALSFETMVEGSLYDFCINIEEIRTASSNKNIDEQLKNALANKIDIVYSCLDLHPKTAEDIAVLCNLPPQEVLSDLVILQIEGKIEEAVRGYYIAKVIDK